MATQFTEREVTKGEIRQAISAVQTLIDWSSTLEPSFRDCITCGTPTFESTVMDAAKDACQFLKDLLL